MVPGGPCNTFRELVDDAQVADREMILHVQDAVHGDVLQIGKAAKFSKKDPDDNVIASAPVLGADTDAYLEQLGMAAEADKLKEEGII